MLRSESAMVAATSLAARRPAAADDEPRILIGGVPWAVYVVLRDAIESPGVRMTYLEGWLEIMSPSRTHEVNKKQIARLLELFCLERDIPLFGIYPFQSRTGVERAGAWARYFP